MIKVNSKEEFLQVLGNFDGQAKYWSHGGNVYMCDCSEENIKMIGINWDYAFSEKLYVDFEELFG